MRLVSIASGSSGNCIYIGSDQTHILVDAGISNKRIEQGLNEIGLKGKELSAVVITHEHSDHIKGLGVLARRSGVPIYGTKETLDEIRAMKSLGEFPKELYHEIRPDVDFMVGDLTISPFSISHDAANPVAYRVKDGRHQVAVATDIGHYDQYTIDHLQGLDAVLLEANHDVNMLMTGPYPYYLKQRILGDHGHLSNENAGRLLSYILHDNMKHILLGHLSKENNYEALAWQTVRLEIDQGDCPYKASDFPLEVAGRDEMSQIIHLE
jgi:phosphoribosyl 1,2-cyclic phosphodiesterase